MKKIISLIKASMTEGMNIFKLSTKKQSFSSKVLLPIFLTMALMLAVYSYANPLMHELLKVNLAFVVLSIFVIFTSILTLVEGVYKSGSLLFNSRDDNLLLSLPIRKSTVLFIRILKFYVFELMYNSIFLLPVIIGYAYYMHPGFTYYLVSFIGLLLFPIIPILLSSVMGILITYLSSKFRGKNYIQTILTAILLLGVMYLSFNMEGLIDNITKNANSVNEVITRLYYPAGAYVSLVNNFNILKLLEFMAVHVIVFIIFILLIGKVYFNINSNVKAVKLGKRNKNYLVKASSQTWAIIKKELSRFVNSTVFITNAGFGLVLYLIGVIALVIRYDSVVPLLVEIAPTYTLEYINSHISIILLILICFASFMTSITSSMISLEGKSFNILKSLPIEPYTVIKGKIFSAVIIMIPCIIIGNIIMYIKFKFSFISIILTLGAAILLPLFTETIGIIINLKYPKMDAKNDTEVVKQSMSSLIATFSGMGLFLVSVIILFKILMTNLSCNIIVLIFLGLYSLVYILLLLYLRKTCNKSFNNIIVS